jgi:hypothetical protein
MKRLYVFLITIKPRKIFTGKMSKRTPAIRSYAAWKLYYAVKPRQTTRQRHRSIRWKDL